MVEGDGDKAAVPILLRRLLFEVYERFDFAIATPINAKNRGAFIAHFDKFLELARREANCAALIALLDADDDCPKDVAFKLAARARALQLPFPVAIVCAKCEYEVWFLASLESISGQYTGLKTDLTYEKPFEALRDVKGWFSQQMPPGQAYKETQDQAAMTALIDFNRVRERSRSFQRLEHAMRELLDAADRQLTHMVTPQEPELQSPSK